MLDTNFPSICGILFIIAYLLLTVHGFELTIVHNNDVHAHFDEIDKSYGECSKEEAGNLTCYGGEARRNWFIKDVRRRIHNTLVFDAGDRFSGTLWFTEYHGYAAATFINMENYDAVCLGNHEFDRGIEGLVPYLKNLTVPVLDANIDVSREPRLQNMFNASKVFTVDDVKVGVIGYITAETTYISSPGPTVSFLDELETVKREAKALKDQGVHVIIGLCHSGYRMDIKVAKEVPDIDIIVGGHSHTFLFNETEDELPSREKPDGPYPTLVTQTSGRKVLVVQAFSWGKYMGFLNVTFDENLEVESWSGRPVLLDHTIPKDPETQHMIETLRNPLEQLKVKIVGRTTVRLEGERTVCRLQECNLGNMLTDAMIEYHVDRRQSDDHWALSAIALLSGGSIRAPVQPGNVSLGDVLTIFPFGNVIDMVKIRGKHLREAFENSVARYDPVDKPGAFLQVSGAKVVYDLSKEPGNRVVSLDVRCLNCTMPEYSPLEDDVIYNILSTDFTINGGDDFTAISRNIIEHVQTNSLDSDVLRTYFERHIPVFPDTEGRIKFVTEQGVGTGQINNDTDIVQCVTSNPHGNDVTTTDTNKTNHGNNIRSSCIIYLFIMLVSIIILF